MSKKTVCWVLMAISFLAYALGQDTSLPDGEGKGILEDACISCHPLSEVTKYHFTKEAWREVVVRMVTMGATMRESEIPVLVDYLTEHFGPNSRTTSRALPEGEGKAIVERSCTSCHGIEEVTKNQLPRKAWEEMVTAMIALGAQVEQAEISVLVDYLAKNFGPPSTAP